MLEEKQTEARKAAIDRLNARLSIGKATTIPEEIVKAARYSRVDHLFLCGDEHLWGEFDETGDRVVPQGSAGEGDIDLLDYAALMTVRQGGSYPLSSERRCLRRASPQRPCGIEGSRSSIAKAREIRLDGYFAVGPGDSDNTSDPDKQIGFNP
jgi:hypothetical protein